MAHLGEPQEVLDQQTRVGIFNLHNGDLVLSSDHDAVIFVEHYGQVQPSETQTADSLVFVM